MDILVTGGSGFIGTKLLQHLQLNGHNILNLDIRMSKRFADSTKLIDIRDRESLKLHVIGDAVIHLAAVHRDDVKPLSHYRATNVDGTKNLCAALDANGIEKVIFTSSVAVYGFADIDTSENGPICPFNEYGRTKYDAENVLCDWQRKLPERRSLTIVRPTVVFGEGNRGNVYNLLRQINSGLFVMIGNGKNRKSMAYVDNISAFLVYSLSFAPGIHVYNYVDKPDYDMRTLVRKVKSVLRGKNAIGPTLPYFVGLALGYVADGVAVLTRRPLPLSSIRVRKFTSNTTFSSAVYTSSGFVAPVSLEEGMARTLQHEFLGSDDDTEIFFSE